MIINLNVLVTFLHLSVREGGGIAFSQCHGEGKPPHFICTPTPINRLPYRQTPHRQTPHLQTDHIFPSRDTDTEGYGNKRAVHILLECILVADHFNPFRSEDLPWNFYTFNNDCQFVSKDHRLQLIISSLNDVVSFDIVLFCETIHLIV